MHASLYRKVLIANRGEIACRIARTLRRLGIAAATVHSTADAQALHVREVGESVWIGDAPARQSYLDIDAVIAAAKRVGADAVHPGFGFLSENAAFAQRCADAGLTFIGPRPETLALFGDKAQAKTLAQRLGIATAGGLSEPSDDVDALLKALGALPRPCILKAVAGGGGKGMRVLREGDDARAAIESAIREGRSAFGDGRLIAERYLPSSLHVEVQILGDGQGRVMHLWDRECSLQRRHQKVVEEAPASGITPALRERLWAQAVALGEATKYLGLGTVEFAVRGDEAVFLEVNPRLQVEHTVTEAVTGLDLVELQIRAVHGRALPLTEAERPKPQGVAIQARLYAEDAEQNFLPSTGRIAVFEAPTGVRVDAGVATGCEISPHYDPMIAKLIARGATRGQALQALRAALQQTVVLGVTSNRSFLLALLADACVQANEVSTEYIDLWLAARPPAPAPDPAVAALMALWLVQQRAGTATGLRGASGASGASGAWHDAALTGWRLQRLDTPPTPGWQASSATGHWRIGFGAAHPDDLHAAVQGPWRGGGLALTVRVNDHSFAVSLPAAHAPAPGWKTVVVDGTILRLYAHCSDRQAQAVIGDQQLALDVQPVQSTRAGAGAVAQGQVRAPMMGLVIALHAQTGDAVQAGQRLATLESMKMELAITAPVAGRLAWVGCSDKAKVERHQELFRIEAA